MGAEDGMLAAPSRAWSLPSANLGLRPGWEPDFWAVNPSHTPPPLPAPQNTLLIRQVCFLPCVPLMPSSVGEGAAVQRDPHSGCLWGVGGRC